MSQFSRRQALQVLPLLAALTVFPATLPAQVKVPMGGGASEELPAVPRKKTIKTPMVYEEKNAKLPEVFAEESPDSVSDLQTMQDWVKTLSATVEKYTVAVRLSSSQGSGVIVSKDGYVLTAAHVIQERGTTCTVITHDGQRHQATSVGLINGTDVGLIKINKGNDWPFAKISQDAEISVGDWCLAVGHPNGYISDRRPVVRLGRVTDLNSRNIQTDCILVGGDSGGPLFDMHGRVIGIHSRIGRKSDVNYHIPIDQFVTSWEELTR